MSDAQTKPRDEYISSLALKESDPQIKCTNCQHLFSEERWQPRLRCPNCDVLGYPDRAGLNLLPLQWECPSCQAENRGTTNFCRNCSTGLATRCVSCEAPIYSVACTHCGTHQAQALTISRVEADRQPWVTKQRMAFRSERLQSENLPAAAFDPNYGVSGWRSLSTAVEEVQQTDTPVEANLLTTATASSRQLAIQQAIRWGLRSIAIVGISMVVLLYIDQLLLEMFNFTLITPLIVAQAETVSGFFDNVLIAMTSLDSSLAFASLMVLAFAALLPVFWVLSKNIARRIIP